MKTAQATVGAFVAALLLGGTAASAGTYTKYTADYYRMNPDEHLNKEIKLYVSWLSPIRQKAPPFPCPEGYSLYLAHTAYEGKAGGGPIIVAILKDEGEKYLKRYGTAPDGNRRRISSRKLEGVLKEHQHEGRKGRKRGSMLYVLAGADEKDHTPAAEVQQAARDKYPYLRDGRLYTGDKGVPVEQVIDLLKKERKIMF